MRTRLKLAWNVLRGRPTMAYVAGPIALADTLHLAERTMVVECRFNAALQGQETP